MQPVDLERVLQFRVTHAILEATLGILQRHGRKNCEGRVLWVGRPHNASTFVFLEAWEPAQSNTMFTTLVPTSELLRINQDLAERGLMLAAQVHSHPGSAFHSDTDDDFPICTQQGSLSLVVPDFAKDNPPLPEWAVYRLTPTGWGNALSPSTVVKLIEVKS